MLMMIMMTMIMMIMMMMIMMMFMMMAMGVSCSMNGFQNLKRTRLDPAETNFNEYDDLYDDLYDDDYEKDFKILRGLFSTPLRQTSTFEKAPLRSALLA